MDLVKPGRAAHSAPRVRRFALKVQQFTGPMMAKSLEDTTFYRYHRLLALNEVGGDPSAKALSVRSLSLDDADARQGMAAWHDGDRDARHQARRGCAHADHGAGGNSRRMDQRRGAVEAAQRASSVLTDGECARRRRRSNTCCIRRCWAPGSLDDGSFRRADAGLCAEGGARGQGGDELAQSARGLRGGRKDTSSREFWTARCQANFWTRCETLARRVSLLGALNSLSQITLKATMPGVPDFYQGTEFWDFSLVDPDNRRPVDFAARGRACWRRWRRRTGIAWCRNGRAAI